MSLLFEKIIEVETSGTKRTIFQLKPNLSPYKYLLLI